MLDWYNDQVDAVQAKFDTVLEYLVQRTVDEWSRPEYATLTGRYSKLGELRFDFGNLEYRPIGCFGPGRATFTVLVGATKKGNKYDPRKALDTALERREIILSDLERSDVYDF